MGHVLRVSRACPLRAPPCAACTSPLAVCVVGAASPVCVRSFQSRRLSSRACHMSAAPRICMQGGGGHRVARAGAAPAQIVQRPILAHVLDHRRAARAGAAATQVKHAPSRECPHRVNRSSVRRAAAEVVRASRGCPHRVVAKHGAQAR
eukprot:5737661-Pleurochrysis_carterae.AAC.1